MAVICAVLSGRLNGWSMVAVVDGGMVFALAGRSDWPAGQSNLSLRFSERKCYFAGCSFFLSLNNAPHGPASSLAKHPPTFAELTTALATRRPLLDARPRCRLHPEPPCIGGALLSSSPQPTEDNNVKTFATVHGSYDTSIPLPLFGDSLPPTLNG